MNKRNKNIIIFCAILIVVAVIVLLATMLSTGEIKIEYFTTTPAIMCYFMFAFAALGIGYVVATDWIRRL